MARSRDYRDLLIKSLQDPEEARAYFSAILEECKTCDAEEGRKLLLLALKDIAEAQGGIVELAQRTGLGRQGLYRALSLKGNPKLSTVMAVTQALLTRR